jgi:primosomal protein N' (replication factor Y)
MPDSETSSRPASDAQNPPVHFAGPCEVQVLLPLPLAGAYDYRVPEGMTLQQGDFVVVPLGRREELGVVWGAGTGEVAPEKLKDVVGPVDVPPMPPAVSKTVEWVAAYTLAPPGAVLRMAMSVSAALDPPRPILAYRLGRAREDVRLTDARRRVLAVLADGPPRLPAELAREAGVGVGVVKGLADAGLIEPVMLPPRLISGQPDPDHPGPTLSAPQEDAARALVGMVEADAFGVALLDGVTGSGKTEVYFEAVAAALRRGRQVLVLLPEIALTAQWLQRFRARFGAPPAEWHSDLTSSQRRTTWRAVAEGAASVVVGARSALFLPFPALGLVVVDEEHDQSYKQEDGVAYHARDMAVVRARASAIPVVLASATPSLETLANVEAGRYRALQLPERHGGAAMPHVAAIDMRKDPPSRQSWLSPILRQALAETVAAGEQAMLFLNRRGYAPLTLCRACGHRIQCPHCTAWMVEHRLTGRLMCHHCGTGMPAPRNCPECGAADALVACGPGVERVAEEVAALMPQARLAIMASDTVATPAAAEELVRQVRDHQLDLVIGTQIMAKGHHFPLLTLVGVVDADLGLAGGDLRASERTFQLLNQVAGRAGRAERPGRVLLQTYMPDHPVMAAMLSGDRDGFLAAESETRRAHFMPPYGRLAALIVSGADGRRVDEVARALGKSAPRGEGIEVLGPAPAPFAMLRGRHRRRLLVKARKEANLHGRLRAWLGGVKVPTGVRVQVDIDPYSFL